MTLVFGVQQLIAGSFLFFNAFSICLFRETTASCTRATCIYLPGIRNCTSSPTSFVFVQSLFLVLHTIRFVFRLLHEY